MQLTKRIAFIFTALMFADIASAASVSPTTNFTYTINIAGSSSFRDIIKFDLANLCDANNTVVEFQTQSGGPDLKAYGCFIDGSRLDTVTGSTVQIAYGSSILVYYRSEGGSIYGVGPLAKKSGGDFVKLLRLKVDSGCTGSATPYTCTVGGFNLTNDTFTSGQAIKDFVQLGISDVEPSQFTGENWPSGGFMGNVPTTSDLANIFSIENAAGQAYAVYVNSSVSSTSITLSKQSLTSIFSGLYTDWNQVPNAAGTGFVSTASLPIELCEYTPGSGVQAAASIYFNGQNCSSSLYGFAASSLARNSTMNAELACIGGNTGAIGYASIQALAPSGTSIAKLDGITPSVVNATSGNYDFWYETTFNSGAKLAANNVVEQLAEILVHRLQVPAAFGCPSNCYYYPGIPSNSPSAFRLPNGGNIPALPQADSTEPIALGTRAGNSCQLPVGWN